LRAGEGPSGKYPEQSVAISQPIKKFGLRNKKRGGAVLLLTQGDGNPEQHPVKVVEEEFLKGGRTQKKGDNEIESCSTKSNGVDREKSAQLEDV